MLSNLNFAAEYFCMKIGVLKEQSPDTRVAFTDEGVADLKKMNIDVIIEHGAGEGALISDENYHSVGATTVERTRVFSDADLIIGIRTPDASELSTLAKGKVFMSMFTPLSNQQVVNQLKDLGVTSFSMDFVPRTTRAQAMDVLSSMASVSGYKAVLLAAYELPHFFPMYITAAGSIKPSKVLILGAGVAGLQSIATARRLGAMVEAFDVRAAAKEEVMSLGAKFVEVDGAKDDKSAGGYAVEQTEEYRLKQAKAIHDHATKADVIICTAQIPGKRAPVLIKKETVAEMRPGSVIIDLAASTGGNCELTQDNSTVVSGGVKIIGNSYLTSKMSMDASKMFGKNIINFLKLIVDKEGNLNINLEDDIVKGTIITHQGEIINERVNANYQS
jgi:NAD(P) transhydrogenase subunit alpha